MSHGNTDSTQKPFQSHQSLFAIASRAFRCVDSTQQDDGQHVTVPILPHEGAALFEYWVDLNTKIEACRHFQYINSSTRQLQRHSLTRMRALISAGLIDIAGSQAIILLARERQNLDLIARPSNGARQRREDPVERSRTVSDCGPESLFFVDGTCAGHGAIGPRGRPTEPCMKVADNSISVAHAVTRTEAILLASQWLFGVPPVDNGREHQALPQSVNHLGHRESAAMSLLVQSHLLSVDELQRLSTASDFGRSSTFEADVYANAAQSEIDDSLIDDGGFVWAD